LIYNYCGFNIRNKRKSNRAKLNILYVGRATHEKRVNIVLEIAKKCLDYALPVEFTLIGPLENINAGNLSNVKIIGVVNDYNLLQLYYLESDIILITSSREGFPMALIEAMVHGTVPITTAVGGIPFHVENNNTGFLIDRMNEEEIIQDFFLCIVRLNDDRNLLERISINADIYANKVFSKENFENEYRAILRKG
jgi:L-malate glycosyltransferase